MTPEQVPVTLDRFEGSAIVDELRIARMSPEDTRKAVRCAEGCANAPSNIFFHLGPTVRIHALGLPSFQRHQPDVRFRCYETKIDQAIVPREHNPTAKIMRSDRQHLVNLL